MSTSNKQPTLEIVVPFFCSMTGGQGGCLVLNDLKSGGGCFVLNDLKSGAVIWCSMT